MEAVNKASVLIEALPYIQAFHNKICVVKFGGSMLEDELIRSSVLRDISFMFYAGLRPVLVHGGGPRITEMMNKAGIPAVFKDGKRVTCEKTLEIVKKGLLELNSIIVEELRESNTPAVSVNNMKDIIMCEKADEELGWVGRINNVNAGHIYKIINMPAVPVILPLGADRAGNVYNVNADTAACEVASTLGAEKVVFLSNVDGIMYNNDLLSSLSVKEIGHLIEKKVITGGMLPKVEACIRALKNGVKKAHIISARQKHALLLEIFTDKGIGTQIVWSD